MNISYTDTQVTIEYFFVTVIIPLTLNNALDGVLSNHCGGPVWNRSVYMRFVKSMNDSVSGHAFYFLNKYTHFSINSGKLILNIYTDSGNPIITDLVLGYSFDFTDEFERLAYIIESCFSRQRALRSDPDVDPTHLGC